MHVETLSISTMVPCTPDYQCQITYLCQPVPLPEFFVALVTVWQTACQIRPSRLSGMSLLASFMKKLPARHCLQISWFGGVLLCGGKRRHFPGTE